MDTTKSNTVFSANYGKPNKIMCESSYSIKKANNVAQEHDDYMKAIALSLQDTHLNAGYSVPKKNLPLQVVSPPTRAFLHPSVDGFVSWLESGGQAPPLITSSSYQAINSLLTDGLFKAIYSAAIMKSQPDGPLTRHTVSIRGMVVFVGNDKTQVSRALIANIVWFISMSQSLADDRQRELIRSGLEENPGPVLDMTGNDEMDSPNAGYYYKIVYVHPTSAEPMTVTSVWANFETWVTGGSALLSAHGYYAFCFCRRDVVASTVNPATKDNFDSDSVKFIWHWTQNTYAGPVFLPLTPSPSVPFFKPFTLNPGDYLLMACYETPLLLTTVWQLLWKLMTVEKNPGPFDVKPAISADELAAFLAAAAQHSPASPETMVSEGMSLDALVNAIESNLPPEYKTKVVSNPPSVTVVRDTEPAPLIDDPGTDVPHSDSPLVDDILEDDYAFAIAYLGARCASDSLSEKLLNVSRPIVYPVVHVAAIENGEVVDLSVNHRAHTPGGLLPTRNHPPPIAKKKDHDQTEGQQRVRPATPKTAEQLREQRKRVVERLTNQTLKSIEALGITHENGWKVYVWWRLATSSHNLFKDLDLALRQAMLAEGYSVSDPWGLIPALRRSQDSLPSDFLKFVNTIVDLGTQQTVLLSECEAHNKRQHALNGNPVFTRTTQDIEDAPETQTLVEAPVFEGAYKGPGEWIRYLQVVDTTVSANTHAAQSASYFRANEISNLNAIVLDRGLPLPCVSIIPRQARPIGGGVPAAATQRLPAIRVEAAATSGSPLVETDLSKKIVEAAVAMLSNLARADNTTLGGFNAIDVSVIAKRKPYIPLFLDTMLIKLTMLHDVCLWKMQNGVLYPQSSWPTSMVSAYDVNSYPDVTSNVLTVSVNNSPVFGEDCGGATSLFPFTGLAGNLTFSLDTNSVTAVRRSDAFFLPAALFSSDIDQSLAIAIFVWALSPWPSHMFCANISTTDTNIANIANLRHVITQCLVDIPGQLNLDIILPRASTYRNPTNQPEANGFALVQPRSGTIASTAIGANVMLNIGWTGNPQNYNLCEYLYTWSTAVDSASITAFMQRLLTICGFSKQMPWIREFCTATTHFFPPMVLDTPGNAPNIAFNTDTYNQPALYNSVLPLRTTANWPQTTRTRTDIVVRTLDPLAWNQVCLGLSVSPEYAIASSFAMDLYATSKWLGRRESLVWYAAQATAFASALTGHMINIGMSRQSWINSYAQNDYPGWSEVSRDHYHRGLQFNGSLEPGNVATKIKHWLSNVLGTSVPTVAYGKNMLSIHEIFSVPTDWARLIDNGAANIDGLPITVCDTWVAMFADKLPPHLMMFPPPGGTDPLRPVNKPNFFTMRWSAARISSVYTNETAISQVDIYSVDERTSIERFNEKVAFFACVASNETASGAVPVGGPGVNIFAQQMLPPNANHPILLNRAESLLRCNLNIRPTVTIAGVRVYPVMTGVNANLFYLALVKRSPLANYSWQALGVRGEPSLVTSTTYKGKSYWQKRAAPTKDGNNNSKGGPPNDTAPK